MGKSHLRYGKRLIQAWLPEDLLDRCCEISNRGYTETITEALTQYTEKNKSELELAQERYESLILEATRLKAKIDEFTHTNLKETKKEIVKEVKPKTKDIGPKKSEKELLKNWEFKIWPIIKRKIAEKGIDNVLNDNHMLNNFSKAMCISTGELKEKIRIDSGVV